MRRSMLFVPGNSPNLLMNADILGADAVILDLEDAVSPAEKDSARILVRNVLKNMEFRGCQIIIRINPIDTAFWKKDLEEILSVRNVMIMLPKVNTAEDISVLSSYIGQLEQYYGYEAGSVKIMPLLETALGIEHAFQIASSSNRVEGMLLGGEDLTADLRCKRTKEGTEIFYARTRVVCAARAANIEIYDTPFTDVNDQDGMYRDAEFAKSLGFSGKAAISPRHVDAINEVFSPTQEEIEYAHEVMRTIRMAEKMGKGVVSLRGKMIDAPIVERARQVIELEKAIFGEVDTDD